MQTHRHLTVEVGGDSRRRATFSHNYLRGWIEVDAHGHVVAYELDTSVESLKDRAGRAVAEKLPGAHAAYVGMGTAFARVFRDPAQIEEVLTKCRAAGPDGGACELLREAAGDHWCGACGCPTALKRGCPQKRW